MRSKLSWIGLVSLIIWASTLSVASPVQARVPEGFPAPCLIPSTGVYRAEVYLVFAGTRRHIIDWDTFLNLGFRTEDVVSCGAASSDPEGAAITRLIKGSGPELYWMQGGVRHHIPDMTTFNVMGFQMGDISILPDSVVNAWPEGDPLPSRALAQTLPSPCLIPSGGLYNPDVFLIFSGTRHHIIDWDTFLNLGYHAGDVTICPEARSYPEGYTITRLVKGSTPEVYWMEHGIRRHIPDMATFNAMGLNTANITVLPDAILQRWPLGDPLPEK
jgi:hypothetical protein